MQPRLTPDIMQALMRRRAGGMGGGNTTPAMGQTMQVNPMGAPIGPSRSSLPQQPQTMPTNPLMPSQQAPQAPSSGQGQSQGLPVDGETKNLTKALVQRLLKIL